MLEEIRKEVSGERALARATEIFNSDRRNVYPASAETARNSARRMEEAGLEDVECFSYPADGRTKQGDWVPPQAWDAEEGILEVREPADLSGRLADFRANPLALAMYSASTAGGWVEADLVEWEGLAPDADVRGKIVLTRESAGSVKRSAFSRGAAGIVSWATRHPWLPDEKMDVPDARYWENNCFVPTNSEDGFAFVVTPRQGERLSSALGAGRRVRVRALVKSRLYDGEVVIPTGVVRGETDEEVVLVAHAYEIGAADNASGCGSVLEIVRALNSLIEDGRLPRPRRSIRALLVYEIFGNLAFYIAHPELVPRTVAGLNLDMVGEDHDVTGATMTLVRTPDSLSSFTNDLLARCAREAARGLDGFRFREKPFGLMDNCLSDPQIGIPTPALAHDGDRFYHTEADTPDKLSARTMGVSALAGAWYAHLIASAGEREGAFFAELTRRAAEARLAEKALAAVGRAFQGGELNEPDLWSEMEYCFQREKAAVTSVLRVAGEGLGEFVGGCVDDLRARMEYERDRACAAARKLGARRLSTPTVRRHPESGKLVPRRTVFGVLTLQDLVLEGKEEAKAEYETTFGRPAPSYCLDGYFTHALFWADGTRTVAEIADLLDLQLGRRDEETLVRFFRFLARHGYAGLEESE